MTGVWGWCLFFVLTSAAQPIVQFDLKTEVECEAARKTVMVDHPTAQSWCVPILHDETQRTRARWKVVE